MGHRNRLFGTSGIAHGFYGFYNVIPDLGEMVDFRDVIKSSYTGYEIVNHPITHREDELRSEWINQLFLQLFQIIGCEKVFLWSAMDEFEGGYNAEARYGRIANIKGDLFQGELIPITVGTLRGIDMWGMISGNGQWLKSAHTLQKILKDGEI